MQLLQLETFVNGFMRHIKPVFYAGFCVVLFSFSSILFPQESSSFAEISQFHISIVYGQNGFLDVFVCVIVSMYLLSVVLGQSLLTHDTAQRVSNNSNIYIYTISTSLQ